MATVTDKAIEVAEKFIRQLKDADINVERAVLFGSCVRGQENGAILISPLCHLISQECGFMTVSCCCPLY